MDNYNENDVLRDQQALLEQVKNTTNNSQIIVEDATMSAFGFNDSREVKVNRNI